jgi:hypothetical protein
VASEPSLEYGLRVACAHCGTLAGSFSQNRSAPAAATCAASPAGAIAARFPTRVIAAAAIHAAYTPRIPNPVAMAVNTPAATSAARTIAIGCGTDVTAMRFFFAESE